jgi:gamma-glutamylcyclotransferase (GGCT)/AIG2-like uncharacterized protein YtfP
MENSYLFVYGTLRRQSGHRMGQWLAQQAHYVGEGKVKAHLYKVSYYPAICHGDAWVEGDIYACQDNIWPFLDEFEETTGEHPEYERRLTPVLLTTGQVLEAWVYWYLRSTENLNRLV